MYPASGDRSRGHIPPTEAALALALAPPPRHTTILQFTPHPDLTSVKPYPEHSVSLVLASLSLAEVKLALM